jgi:potassium/hydrogen antiporter
VTTEQLNLALLVGPAVLLASVIAVRLSVGTGLPSLLLYLTVGLAIGEGGLGVRFDDAELTNVLGYAALVLILAEGGLTTRWSLIKPSVAPAALLATVGTVISVLVTGAGAKLVLGTDWPQALLVGAAVSSTDAAAVFSVLRRVPLPPRLVGMLEAESGFNDAPVVIFVVALTTVAAGGEHHSLGILLAEAIYQLVAGALIGLAVGYAGAMAMRKVALPSSGLYPIAILGLAVGAYGAAATVHSSGFLATYLASLVLGNSRLPHGAAVRGFAEGLGWLAQIGLFVLLGLLAAPSRLIEQVVPAVLIGLVLLLVARPLSVLVSASWFKVPLREQAFLSWAGLRGAVPVVLATVPLAAGVPGSVEKFDLVFVLVVIFTLVQAPTLPRIARMLGLAEPVHAVGLEVESSPLGAQGADVLEVKVGKDSLMHGVEIFELRLPEGAHVTLILRDGDALVPGPRTTIRHGDDLIVVSTDAARAQAEYRLRAVSLGGKLAQWKHVAPPPPATPAVRRPGELSAARRIRGLRRRVVPGARPGRSS